MVPFAKTNPPRDSVRPDVHGHVEIRDRRRRDCLAIAACLESFEFVERGREQVVEVARYWLARGIRCYSSPRSVPSAGIPLRFCVRQE